MHDYRFYCWMGPDDSGQSVNEALGRCSKDLVGYVSASNHMCDSVCRRESSLCIGATGVHENREGLYMWPRNGREGANVQPGNVPVSRAIVATKPICMNNLYTEVCCHGNFKAIFQSKRQDPHRCIYYSDQWSKRETIQRGQQSVLSFMPIKCLIQSLFFT